MKIRTNNTGVKRDLDRLIAKPVHGVEVFCIAIYKDYKAYRVKLNPALNLEDMVKELSPETAEISLG